MSISQEEHRLLYRVAQAYYQDGLTQREIGLRFGLSRPKISRLLQKARDERVVNITLVPPTGGLADMERDLEDHFGLTEVVLVTVTDPEDPESITRELGPAAAEALVRSIHGDEIIGMSWGASVMGVVDALPALSMPELTIVQIMGGLGPADADEHSTELARRMAQKFNARLRLLPSPGVVSTREAARTLRAEPAIAQTLILAEQAETAIVGLGVPDSYYLSRSTLLGPEDRAQLEREGAVGDIALRYIDAEGVPLDLDINARTVGLTLEHIRAIPRVIGVAGGTRKIDMIRAALRGHWIDVLVTDHHTAEVLLRTTGFDEMAE